LLLFLLSSGVPFATAVAESWLFLFIVLLPEAAETTKIRDAPTFI